MIRTSYGGVGRNLADCLSRLEESPLFISAIGDDVHGESLVRHNLKMDVSGVKKMKGFSTAVCTVILDKNGENVCEIGDMSIHQQISVDQIRHHEDSIKNASLVAFDGNVSTEAISYLLQTCRKYRRPVWFEPTDVNVAWKPFKTTEWTSITYTSPNLNELRVIANAICDTEDATTSPSTESNMDKLFAEIAQLCQPLLQVMHTVFVTLGARGVVLVTKLPEGCPFPQAPLNYDFHMNSTRILHYPALSVDHIKSVSGAGDCLAGGIIRSLIRCKSLDECIGAGIRAAVSSLASYQAVPGNLSKEKLFEN